MSSRPSKSSPNTEFRRKITEIFLKAPHPHRRNRHASAATPTARPMGRMIIGNPFCADENVRTQLYLERPFSRVLALPSSKKPAMFHAYQETARMLPMMRSMKLRCAKQRHQFEMGRTYRTNTAVPTLPETVTLTMEVQGQEFRNLILCDLPWINFTTDNIHQISVDHPDVIIELSDQMDLKDVMADTFNQIRVSGPIRDTEEARRRLLEMCPLILCLPVLNQSTISPNSIVQNLKDLQSTDGPLSQFTMVQFFTSKNLQPGFGIEGSLGSAFKSIDAECEIYIIIKGAVRDILLIRAAAETLRSVLYPIPMKKPVFLSAIDFPQTLEPWLNGPEVALHLATKTGASILTPNFTQNRGVNIVMTFFIHGEAACVLTTVTELHRIVPIRLTFHCDDKDLKRGPFMHLNQRVLDYVDTDNCFLIEFRPSEFEVSHGEKRHCITICSSHENINIVYAVYAWILGTNNVPVNTRDNTSMLQFTRKTLELLKKRNALDTSEELYNETMKLTRSIVFLKELPNPYASTYKGYDYEGLQKPYPTCEEIPFVPTPNPVTPPTFVPGVIQPTTPLLFFFQPKSIPTPCSTVTPGSASSVFTFDMGTSVGSPMQPMATYPIPQPMQAPPTPQFMPMMTSEHMLTPPPFDPRPPRTNSYNSFRGGRTFYRNRNTRNPYFSRPN